jgi:hypothetical protein
MSGTRINLQNGRWYINGRVSYPGSRAEGLLMNVRMVNAVFEDLNRPEYIPHEITSRFIRRIPEYVRSGIRAFTLCLQGGHAGYEGPINSAYRSDGSLNPGYLDRVRRVVEACSQAGAAVILTCYYQRQSAILKDEAALRAGVANTADWIAREGFTNLLLEITNEFGHDGFTHPMLNDPEGQVSLIDLARRVAPGLLLSTSRQGHKGISAAVCKACDFCLIHFNRVPLDSMPAMIAELHRYGKPVVCNEDRKIGAEGAEAARICVDHGCSWGLMAREVNQYTPPFRFDGAQDDPEVYAMIGQLTTSQPRTER